MMPPIPASIAVQAAIVAIADRIVIRTSIAEPIPSDSMYRMTTRLSRVFAPRASLLRAYAARLNEEITRLVPFALVFYISIPSTSALLGTRGFC